MIALLFIAIAAICKALADTLDHHFDTSKFKNKNRGFWDPNIIHKTTKQVFGYPLDAWHLTNSLQICSWMTLAVIYEPCFNRWIDFCIGGAAFIIVFNLFYNKLFR